MRCALPLALVLLTALSICACSSPERPAFVNRSSVSLRVDVYLGVTLSPFGAGASGRATSATLAPGASWNGRKGETGTAPDLKMVNGPTLIRVTGPGAPTRMWVIPERSHATVVLEGSAPAISATALIVQPDGSSQRRPLEITTLDWFRTHKPPADPPE
jgi:hypothetical protein